MVKLSEYAAALGIPEHGPPGILNDRVCPAEYAGPPYGPTGLRVSTTRHGVTLRKTDAAVLEPTLKRFGGVQLESGMFCAANDEQQRTRTAMIPMCRERLLMDPPLISSGRGFRSK